MDGDVPLEVVRQALNAIPTIVGDGQRKEWLALAMSVESGKSRSQGHFRSVAADVAAVRTLRSITFGIAFIRSPGHT